MKSHANILFVDDDRHLTRSMQDFLTHEGFNVTAASNAEAALKALDTCQPDIIILDISMPGMGGIGFLKRIGKEDGTLKYPVLVLTARAAMNDFFNMLAVDGFLPKPCSEIDILRMIKQILNKTKGRSGRDHNVLVGEDDPRITADMLRSFEIAGYHLHFVTSGPEMLEQAVTILPDVIIIKELFPGMNGSSVSSLLKSIPKTENIPIVIHDETRSNGPAPRHKAEKYLFQPHLSDLLHAVTQLLETGTETAATTTQ